MYAAPTAAMPHTKSVRSITEQQQARKVHSFSSGHRQKCQTGSCNSIDSLCSSFSSEPKLQKRPPVHHTHSEQEGGSGGSDVHHQLLSSRYSNEISGKQAMHEFSHRLEVAKDLLYKGVPVTVWDRCKQQELSVKLSNELGMTNEDVPQLQFTTSRSYLVWRQPCKPFDLDCKIQIQMGVRGEQRGRIDPDDELSVTLFRVSENFGDSERSLVMRCSDEKTCRDLFSAVRTILTDVSLRASGVNTSDDTVALASSPNSAPASDSDFILEPPDQSNDSNYRERILKLESELAEERRKCQEIMLQMMEAANGGNNKEVEINALRGELRSLKGDIDDMKQMNSTHMNMYSKAVKRMEAYQFECEELQLENAILHQKAAV